MFWKWHIPLYPFLAGPFVALFFLDIVYTWLWEDGKRKFSLIVRFMKAFKPFIGKIDLDSILATV